MIYTVEREFHIREQKIRLILFLSFSPQRRCVFLWLSWSVVCEQTGSSSARLVKPGNELLSAITRCVSVARGTLCPMMAIDALGAAAAKQRRWLQAYISITELACRFSSSPVAFPSLHFLYLIWLADRSGSSLQGCWQAAFFFFSHSSVMSWEIWFQLLFSLTSDEGGMAAGGGNCSSHWDGFKNAWRTIPSVHQCWH